MAKPRVFISSTYYDLSYVRDDIERFITSIGYEPVRHEKGAIAYSKEAALEESVYKEIGLCDIIVCIIGGRYGAGSSTRDGSITQNELKQAIENGTQIYIFIEQAVYAEYETYRINKTNIEIKYKHVDNKDIYGFIETLYALPPMNSISPFKTSTDICSYLSNQWAGLFQQFLNEKRRKLELSALMEMKDMVSTLKQIVSLYDEESKGNHEVIENLISSVHPAYEAFKKITNTTYRVYFTSLVELNNWLFARSYEYFSNQDGYDKGSIHEWLRKDRKLYIALKHQIFNENGTLKKILPADWREDWLEINELKEPISEPTEDIPF